MADLDEIRRRFRALGADHGGRSPFQARICAALADTPDVAGLLLAAPVEQRMPVLLMAAVHSLVLAEPGSELAAYYPTVTDAPRTGDPSPTFVAFCRDHADRIRGLVATHRTQTNEVGRSALFLPALGLLGVEPLALVDVGTSAGLNLQLDRFSYEYEPGGRVGERSTVHLTCGTRGAVPVPTSLPTVTARIGIDPSPIDLDDDDARRWLMACVWPDQPDRFVRLAAAIELARAHPPTIRTADAVSGVGAAIDEVAGDGHPVVLTSWVLNYLSEDERAAFVGALDDVGATRDLAWIFAEQPSACAGLPFDPGVAHSDLTELSVATWRDGERVTTHLGSAHPHGYWLHWRDR